MTEDQTSSLADAIRDARERLGAELRAQAEHILRLSQGVSALQLLHGRTEQEAAHQWDEVERAAAGASEAASAAAQAATADAVAAAVAAVPKTSPDAGLEQILNAIRSLTTCTLPEQLFEVLTEESAKLGVRAAVFDVRGKAAWGASAHGFGPAVTDRVVRSLIVQVNQDNPFRQVCETAEPVDVTAEALRKNRNVLDKLKPPLHAHVLLLPIRSAGAVSAIFYADPTDGTQILPAKALQILAEFAGAQIDRLIALSGGAAEEPEQNVEQGVLEAAETDLPVADVQAASAAVPPAVADAATAAADSSQAPGQIPAEPAVSEPAHVQPDVDAHPKAADAPAPDGHAYPAEAGAPEVPAVEQTVATAMPAPHAAIHEVKSEVESAVTEHHDEPLVPPFPPDPILTHAPSIEPLSVEAPHLVTVEESSSPAVAPAFDIAQLSASEQKIHKDAKRFARILVSEIELYNRSKVAEGRQHHDLYKRLRSDIDRSRQTYDKRFGKVLDKQFDYFYDELVKALAMNDPALLGPEYPGSPA